MVKLLSMLFTVAIVFSLATSVLAQSGGAANVQAMEKLTKKTMKTHEKKHKHIVVAEGKGSVKGVNTSRTRSNAQPA